MKLENTLRSILIETHQDIIEDLVNENYTVKYNIERSEHFYGQFNMSLKLIPKSTEAKNLSDEPIILYSAFKMIRNNPRITDTNSAYNKGGIFKVLGLINELNDWLYYKSKEIIKTYVEENNIN